MNLHLLTFPQMSTGKLMEDNLLQCLYERVFLYLLQNDQIGCNLQQLEMYFPSTPLMSRLLIIAGRLG